MKKIVFRNVSLQGLRNIIIDLNDYEFDTIYLNDIDFDEIALQYREEHNESIEEPFKFVGTCIISVCSEELKQGYIGIDDNEVDESNELNEFNQTPPFYEVYRCGWCGNIVEQDGTLLDEDVLSMKIDTLDKYKEQIKHISVEGKCCLENN